MSCRPSPDKAWSHQVVQRSIRCRQSKFLFRFSNLPLPASACRQVANRNPRRWRNLKKCVLKVNSSFLFFPFRSAQRRRYDLSFMILATLTSLKIWNQTAASDVWMGDFFSWWICCPSWTILLTQVPIYSRVYKNFSPTFYQKIFLKSYTTSWTSERRAKEAGEKKGANQSSQKESKATKESSSHSHDHCCNAFSLQKEAEKTPSWCRHAWTASIMLASASRVPLQ